MNLFFRLIFLLARNLIAGRTIDYLDTRTLRFRVWITDQDAFQHMNNSRYMSIMDLAVIDLVMRTGVATGMRKHRLTPVVVYKDIALYRMLKFPQAYQVISRFVAWDGPYIFFEHRFERNGRLHARGVTIGRLVGRSGERPTVQQAIEQLGWQNVPKSPPMPEDGLREIARLEEIRKHRAESEKAA